MKSFGNFALCLSANCLMLAAVSMCFEQVVESSLFAGMSLMAAGLGCLARGIHAIDGAGGGDA
jgi:hypothetical protein